jgi:hypothetical protein
MGAAMKKSAEDPGADAQDPDGDPEMKTSGTDQPNQAEGDDEPAETQ